MVIQSGFGQFIKEANDPSFFKIFRKEDLSSEITRMIPHHVIQAISNSSFKMVLKVPWGSSWPVKISKNPRFYFMEDCGWNQFVNDNALGEDEYLTFTHEADMCFNVSIYEANGTERLKPATIASSSRRNKGEQRKKNIEKDDMKEETEASTELSYSSLKTGRRLKQKRKKVEEAETSRRKKSKKVTNGDNSEANTSSRVPEFTLTIKPSYLVFLAIPKKFVEMHMPNESTMFKIHHPKGKKHWEVKYLVTDTQSRFSAGWGRLTKDLDLQAGDVCTFKLIKPCEMLLKVSK